MTLQIDTAQIRRFLDALFRYADNTGYISLRSFPDSKDGVPEIKSIAINNRDDVLTAACAMAERCATNSDPRVFCPPIATFNNPKKADEKSLANGLALSVECDQKPLAARKTLESLLGAATLVVESGGKWTNPETGEIEAKLHLHWRLTEPTRTPEDHHRLKEARTLATSLVWGDASNKPIVHPIRWAGSWHRKKTPTLTKIVAETNNEIELNNALAELKEAVAAAGISQEKSNSSNEPKTETGESRDMALLISEITSGNDYHAPLTALAMRYLRGGMSDAQVVQTLRGVMEAVPKEIRDVKDGVKQTGRWQSRYDEIPRAVLSARSKIDAEEREWPDPLPIYTELYKVEAFDSKVLLPDVLHDWVTDISGRMSCPPDFVATSVLVALGSVIGARCVMRPKKFDDWIIVPNLWGGIVGLPSAKKSPAISAAFKPLDRIIALAKEKHDKETATFNTGKILRDARKDALEDQLKKAVKQEVSNMSKGKVQ